MADKKVDDEMLKWLDALTEFDPAEDADVVELVENAEDLDMHEAATEGALDEYGKE